MNNDKNAFNDADVLADHNRLVRELDVLLNGEAGAAQQASLCDIVAQIRRERAKEVDGQNVPVHLVRSPGSICWEDISGESLEFCRAQPAEYEIRTLYPCPVLQHQGAAVQLRFPTMLRKMWSGGEVQKWIEEQGTLYHEAPKSQGADAALRKVYDLIGLHYSHDVSVLLANFQNMKRFSEYLHAIEREFFMVPGVPSDEPEDAGSDPDDECLMNCWGSTQEQYVEQFRNALAYLASKAGPAGAGAPE